jgi:hypothetical protein
MTVIFAVIWSVLLLTACQPAMGRLLGMRVSRILSLIAGGLGIGAGWVCAQVLGAGLTGIGARRRLRLQLIADRPGHGIGRRPHGPLLPAGLRPPVRQRRASSSSRAADAACPVPPLRAAGAARIPARLRPLGGGQPLL